MVRPTPVPRPVVVFPVVVDTDPKRGTKIDPDHIVKVYFGEKTSGPYIQMNKNLLINLDTVHKLQE